MTYEVTIEPLGECIEVEEDQTILDAALRAGIWLPHACCHGLCAILAEKPAPYKRRKGCGYRRNIQRYAR